MKDLQKFSPTVLDLILELSLYNLQERANNIIISIFINTGNDNHLSLLIDFLSLKNYHYQMFWSLMW